MRSRQRGQAFLLTLLLLGILLAALTYRMVRPANITAQNDLKTEAALAQARDALLGYAASDATRPGQLPCPDRDNNGFADNCAAAGDPTSLRIGRLPFRNLRIPELRDGSGEPLWYAVSRNFAATAIINSDTVAEYTVTGTTPASNVVAIIFAPGPVVGTQMRDTSIAMCGTTATASARNLCAANYVEGGNEDGNASFVSALPAAAFNDKLLAITHDMLLKRVLQRVANHARKVLLAYYNNPVNGYFPTANAYGSGSSLCTDSTFQGKIPLAPTIITKSGLCTDSLSWSSGANYDAWFAANNWNRYIFYAVSPACTDKATAAACTGGGSLIVTGKSTSVRALLIATGLAKTSQNRPCASAADCLEDAENTNGDATFMMPAPSSTNNDQLIIVSP